MIIKQNNDNKKNHDSNNGKYFIQQKTVDSLQQPGITDPSNTKEKFQSWNRCNKNISFICQYL